MKRVNLTNTDSVLALAHSLRVRPTSESPAIAKAVVEILADVRSRGDRAVLEWTRKWDFPDANRLLVPSEAIDAAVERVATTDLWPALQIAADRIRRFHEAHRRTTWLDCSEPGDILGQRLLPLDQVGVYVPGGRADYPSTVLMTGIPARVAGVRRCVLATPPSRETGLPPDATLAAARLAGFDAVFGMGGAQAIGAMAYGTESIPQVDKIVGPGNAYVNAAKRLVFGAVGIDMLAGPSEVGIVADDDADPGNVVVEWICQTEHDPDNASLVVVFSERSADAVVAEWERQLEDLPRRDIVRESVERNGILVVAANVDAAATLMNAYAPEHLHLDLKGAWDVLPLFRNAGAILLGPCSSAAHGDYVAGPSHTLPTGGAARYAGPLNVDDFMRKTSLIALDRQTASRLAPAAATIARFEGLEGHRRSAVHGDTDL